jgi:hypothetical protein
MSSVAEVHRADSRLEGMPSLRNPLTRTVLEAFRLIRALQSEVLAYAELLKLVLEQQHELDREHRRLQQRYYALLDQHRRPTQGSKLAPEENAA